MNDQDQRIKATEREYLATRPRALPEILRPLPRLAGSAARSKWSWLGLLLLAGVYGVFHWTRAAEARGEAPTFEVKRGALDITVLEGGNVQSLNSQVVRSRVSGRDGNKIIFIVPEGYAVTEKDIAEGKVLVRLDSSAIEDRITDQEIELQRNEAELIEAINERDVQISDNLSSTKESEQGIRFARLDFEKYMGVEAAGEIFEALQLEEKVLAQVAESPESAARVSGGPASSRIVETITRSSMPGPAASPGRVATNRLPGTVNLLTVGAAAFDFSRYAEADKEHLLGDGEARQSLRTHQDEVLVAEQELELAKEDYEGTVRLSEKGFVTRNELEKQRIAYQKAQLKVQTARAALNLFKRYELTRQAEEHLSAYEEALRLYFRTLKDNIAELASEEAGVQSAQRRYGIEKKDLEELYEQLDFCEIRATTPGLLVYGGGEDDSARTRDPIREGTVVWERQPILTIPDLSRMTVELKVPEGYVKLIRAGQRARIRLDAERERQLEGEVAHVSVLPDSQNRWLNPDVKIYLTTVNILGTHDWLKPGMSAQVEIMVDELDDVLFAPVQAVHKLGESWVCQVVTEDQVELREIEIGGYNDEFVEIRSGLNEGVRVSLAALDLDGGENSKPAILPDTDAASTNGIPPLVSVE
ncbi:MAG TPA: HlyD family efflux transporter periplasmic adaptor subunit [Verrucomicrobiae bacterium]|nr:HlyD family efflux transporter periplasmic adaptor subunit [Verrucomicrobiae bacterium]